MRGGGWRLKCICVGRVYAVKTGAAERTSPHLKNPGRVLQAGSGIPIAVVKRRAYLPCMFLSCFLIVEVAEERGFGDAQHCNG